MKKNIAIVNEKVVVIKQKFNIDLIEVLKKNHSSVMRTPNCGMASCSSSTCCSSH